MFLGARSFNQPLNKWNVSNVRDMRRMFRHATSFNQPLNNWDVSKVTDMSEMFLGEISFNQPLKWNVSNVETMNSMFADAEAFNQPLNKWDVSNVTNMWSMFKNASSFNQPLNKWNVSNVTDMRWMFADAEAFNQPIDTWNVSKVTHFGILYIYRMFDGATSFNQRLPLKLRPLLEGNENADAMDTTEDADAMDTTEDEFELDEFEAKIDKISYANTGKVVISGSDVLFMRKLAPADREISFDLLFNKGQLEKLSPTVGDLCANSPNGKTGGCSMLAGQGSVSAHTHPRGERVSAADFAAALANHPRVNKFGNRLASMVVAPKGLYVYVPTTSLINTWKDTSFPLRKKLQLYWKWVGHQLQEDTQKGNVDDYLKFFRSQGWKLSYTPYEQIRPNDSIVLTVC